MKPKDLALILTLCTILLLTDPASVTTEAVAAAQQPTTADAAPTTAPARSERRYKKPLWGTDQTRVTNAGRGGEKNGAGDEAVARPSGPVDVLLPNHLVGTSSPDAALYWFVYEPVEHPVVLSLSDATAMETRTVRLQRVEPGLHRVSLSQFGLPLEPRRQYIFQVELMVDEEDNNPFVASRFAYIEPTDELRRALDAATTDEERALACAAGGLWVDALAAVNEGLRSDPSNAQLRQLRADLLAEDGLTRLAQHESLRPK